MEGRSSLALSYDYSDNRFQLTQRVPRSDPQNAKANILEIRLAQRVDANLPAAVMRFAIHLNQQTSRQAGKIHNVTSDWVLTPEFEPTGSQTKRTP